MVWLVIEAVRRLDTSAFHARRRRTGPGRPGYDPDMMVALLVWAYANGITSSRRIERLCQQDVAFRVTCAGRAPDHVTIARFRQQFAETAADLFAQVLVLCARLGMGQVGVVALDGTKIAANASKDANRTEEGLRKLAAEMAAAHAEADGREDALFGEGGAGTTTPATRAPAQERVDAALASLKAEREAREAAERAAADDAWSGRGPGPRRAAALRPAPGSPWPRSASPGRPPPTRRRPRAGREQAATAAGRRQYRPRSTAGSARPARRSSGPGGSTPGRAQDAGDRRRRSGTSRPGGTSPTPDSRLMPVRGGGFLQGYRYQWNVTSEDGLVIATRLTNTTNDVRWYEPMITEAMGAAAMMGAAGGPGDGEIGLALADAGYLSEANLTCPGPDRLIAAGKRRDLEKAARAAAGGAAGGRQRRPPRRWPPASPPKTASPPTAGAPTSARPSTATSSTTRASAA